MAISFLLAYWRLLLIATLCGLLALQTWRLDQKKDDLNKIKTFTLMAREQSDATIDRLREAIPPMVEMARNNAVRNYQAKFGTCPVAGGIRAANGVLPNYDSQAGSSSSSNEPHQSEPVACDPATLEAAAVDAVMLEAWKDWARSNGLKAK